MRLTRDLSIGYKILIPPLIMMAALGTMLLLTLQGFDRQGRVIRNVQEIHEKRVSFLARFMLTSEQVQSDLFRVSVLRFMKVPENEVSAVHNRLEQGLSRLIIMYGRILSDWPLSPEEKDLLEQTRIPLVAFEKQARQAVDLVLQNPSFGIQLVRSAALPFHRFRTLLDQFLLYQEARMAKAERDSTRTVAHVKTTMLIISAATVLLAIFVTVLVGRQAISVPVRTMTRLMGQLARGDLSVRVEDLDRKDEIGSMARAVEVFRENAVQKQAAEEALRESERMLNATGRMARVGGWEFDADTLQLTWTDEVYRIHEVDPSYRPDVHKAIAFYHPESLPQIEKAVQEAVERGKPFDLELRLITANGNHRWVRAMGEAREAEGKVVKLFGTFQDITLRKEAEAERERLIGELREALAEVKQLSGLLPICSSCKKIRDDKGYWTQIETYIHKHSDAQFSHGICPECAKKLYPELNLYEH
jgi:PAS domain S-box-containing protein